MFHLTLMLATLLCAMVAGFVFAFAVVVMPGLRTLSDKEFLRSFQVIDGVIQKGHPLFGLVWAGSVLALVASAILGYGRLQGANWVLCIAAVAIYLLGVQLPTITINIPLNNALQARELGTLDGPALTAARQAFEPRWLRWNTVRTLLATLVSVLLLVLLSRV